MKISPEAKFVMDNLEEGLKIESLEKEVDQDLCYLLDVLNNPPYGIIDAGLVAMYGKDGPSSISIDVFFSTHEADIQISKEDLFLSYLIREKKGEMKFTYQESIAIRNRILPIVEMMLL